MAFLLVLFKVCSLAHLLAVMDAKKIKSGNLKGS
jgi:hypothetical protein